METKSEDESGLFFLGGPLSSNPISKRADKSSTLMGMLLCMSNAQMIWKEYLNELIGDY